MFQVNEVVVYRNQVYRIVEKKRADRNQGEVYILTPYHKQEGLIAQLKIPTENRQGYLRKLSSQAKIEQLIEAMPTIPIIEGNSRMIEAECKQLLKNATPEKLVSIIKTMWLRGQERIEQHKKIASTDDHIFKQAERILYEEIAAVYQIGVDEAKQLVLSRVKEEEK